MAYRVLLVQPPHPLTDCAKATFKTVIGSLQEAVICPTGLESTREIHALDFGELEGTDESFESNTIFEDYGNPLASEIGPATPPARGLQLDRIGLIIGCWLLPGLGPLPGADDPRLVAYDSARLGWRTLDLVCWRGEWHNGPVGFEIGNQRILSGTWIDSYGSRSRLFETH